ncbi:MAG: YHYH protein [Chthoniobacteraceae bacterium]
MSATSPASQSPLLSTGIVATGIALLSATSLLLAQRPGADGPPGIRSNRPGGDPNAKRENVVSITTEGGHRVIKSNGWPDHAPGQFPRRGNPNTASPQDYTFRVTLKPVAAAEPQRRGGWFFAVAVNGVPFEAGTAETWNNDRNSGWRYEAHTGFLDLGLDENNAHVQPTGAYHYHATPTGLVQRLGGDEGKVLLVAWAADGFPMYTANCASDPKDAKSAVRTMKSSYRLKPGARPQEAGGPGGNYDGRFTQDWEYVRDSGDLDECNGHTAPTPEHPEGTYHYHITTTFPFLPRMWHGTPDESFGKGGPGPGGPRGQLGAGRRPQFPGAPGEAGGPGGPGGPGMMPGGFPLPLIIRALDANGDGILDADEIANAPAALRKLDRNGDGKLTPDEYLGPRMPFGGPPGGRPGGPPNGPPGGPPPAR